MMAFYIYNVYICKFAILFLRVLLIYGDYGHV